jgi:hypothetical protein
MPFHTTISYFRCIKPFRNAFHAIPQSGFRRIKPFRTTFPAIHVKLHASGKSSHSQNEPPSMPARQSTGDSSVEAGVRPVPYRYGEFSLMSSQFSKVLSFSDDICDLGVGFGPLPNKKERRTIDALIRQAMPLPDSPSARCANASHKSNFSFKTAEWA